MKTSVTLGVVALFAAVTGAYIYFIPNEPPAVVKANAPQKIMPAGENTPVRWLQIQNTENNTVITLEKTADKWMIRFPVVYPADTLMVEGLATALRVSSRARRLLREKDWDEYGLLRPPLKIGIETEGGKRRYLYFGDPSPVGPFVFARWEGDEEYFLVSVDLKKAFSRSVYSMRLKQVFRTPLNEVTRMRIRTLDNEYEVEKKGNTWYWLEPLNLLGQKLEKRYVDQLVSQYADLYVKEFLDQEKTPESDLGFSLTSPWIKLWGRNPPVSAGSRDSESPVSAHKNPKEEVELIKIGEEQPPRDSFIAYHGTDKIYFLIARSNVRKLFQIFETMAQTKIPQPAAAPALVDAASSDLVALKAKQAEIQ